jgi:hypothetical protein
MSRSSIDEGFLTEDDPVSSDDGYTESVLNWQASLRQEWVARSHGDENLAVASGPEQTLAVESDREQNQGSGVDRVRNDAAYGDRERSRQVVESSAESDSDRGPVAPFPLPRQIPGSSLSSWHPFASSLEAFPTPHACTHTHTHTHAQAHTPALHSDRCLNCASAALFQWDVPGSAHHQ